MSPLNSETVALLKKRLEEAERNLQLCRQLLEENSTGTELNTKPSATVNLESEIPEEGQKIIHGTFDGEHMNGEDGQLYPVPANYASKSKLVEGDSLKLTIEPDGAFVYKQVGPIERRREKGIFEVSEDGRNVVKAKDKEYRILLASVTFYHIEPGDEVTVLLPEEGDAQWGAVDNVIKLGEKDSLDDTVVLE